MNKRRMEPDAHQERHQLLHLALDELCADFIAVKGGDVRYLHLNEVTVVDLLTWSNEQAKNPTALVNSLSEDYSGIYHNPFAAKSAKVQLLLYPSRSQQLEFPQLRIINATKSK